MIGYVTVGTKDPKKAAAFYDKIASELGAVRVMDNDRIIAWGKPVTVGNGVMAALRAKDKAQVDRVYKLALSLGGTCEGPPGPRGSSGFYAAYFRDPEGNKLNAYVMG